MSEYACKVCEAEPDDEGCIVHGRGCYVASAEGGGCTFVTFDADVIPTIQVCVSIAAYILNAAQGLEGDAAAQLHALADGILEDRYRHEPSHYVRPTVTSSSVGPVTVDVEMARKNGWAEWQIARCVLNCDAASRLENRVVNHAKGYTRICEACEQWTRPEGECHLCEKDRIANAEVRRRKRPVDMGWPEARKAAGANTAVCPECDGTGDNGDGQGYCYRCLGGGWDDCECGERATCPLHGPLHDGVDE